MLVRQRCAKRGPRQSVFPETGKKAKKVAQNNNLAIVERRKLMNTKSAGANRRNGQPRNDLKVFRQNTVCTEALDNNFDRVGSVSPLKYRPRIDMDGLQEEDYYHRANTYGRKTPDGDMATPARSARSLGQRGAATNRSNSRRSILKSTKSQNVLDVVSPQIP